MMRWSASRVDVGRVGLEMRRRTTGRKSHHRQASRCLTWCSTLRLGPSLLGLLALSRRPTRESRRKGNHHSEAQPGRPTRACVDGARRRRGHERKRESRVINHSRQSSTTHHHPPPSHSQPAATMSNGDTEMADANAASSSSKGKGKGKASDIAVAQANAAGDEDLLPWVEKYRPVTLDDLVSHRDITTTGEHHRHTAD